MNIRPACAALALLFLAGCATDSPDPGAAADAQPAGTAAGDAAQPQAAPAGDGAGAGGAAGAAVASGNGADGEPVMHTLTGADPGLTPPAPPAEPEVPPTTEKGGAPVEGPTTADMDLVGGARNWKSGQSATHPGTTDASNQMPAPKRDGQAHRYELRAYGTNIEVYMDGQPVPANRVVMAGNQVGVLDAKGAAVIERLDLPAGWTEDAQKAALPDPNDPYDFRDVHGARLTPPKVMLGGRLVDPSPAIIKHMGDRGVKRDRASLVTNVIPGLPLATAGVENDDIVVAVNEVPDADPESIRAVLRTMKPGETISLRVQRGAQTIDAVVTAAPWEAKHMVRPMGAGGSQGVGGTGVAPAQPKPAKSAEEMRADAAAANAAMAAQAEQLKATAAKLEADLAAAKKKIAELDKRLSDNDPVRRSIRPAAAPAPTAAGTAPGTAPAKKTAP